MPHNRSQIGATLSLAAFAALAAGLLTHATWLSTLDAAGFAGLAHHSRVATRFFAAVATVSSPLVAMLATCALGLWVARRDRTASIFIVGSQFGGSAIAELCKLTFARPRPTHQLIADTGASFPSGHTFCTAMLVACVLWVLLPRLQDPEWQLVAVLVAVIWLALVAVARVYLRDHYPSDVLASIFLAGGWWGWLQSLRLPAVRFLKGSH